MTMDLSAIPLLDHHCHALGRPGPPLDAPSFRRFFSETSDPAMAPHVEFGLFYRRALRDLAMLLGCGPGEEGVLKARAETAFPDYSARLFSAANIAILLVDTGFRSAENYALDEMRDLTPCRIHEVLRLETLMEQSIVEAPNYEQMEESFRAYLQDARRKGIVAFKTVAAYRGGLETAPRTQDEAKSIYPALKEAALHDGRLRLSARPLLEYLLQIGLEAAAKQNLPVQVHTGFGDADADLRSANPLHLRRLLEDNALRGVSFVLLHTYPYFREAGHLASLYGNVYIDLSLTIPFAAHAGVEAIRGALELAPTSKVLLATDAFTIPELFYLGALYGRQALGIVLSQLRQEGWLDDDQAQTAAWQILYSNAATLYGLSD